MKRQSALYSVGVVAVLLAAIPAEAAKPWQTALEQYLAKNYELTKTGLDRVRITSAGTLLVIRKENISGNIASDMFMVNNRITDGKVRQGSGAGSSRVFKTGEKVYVIKLDVKDDAVDLLVISGDTFEVTEHGSTKQTRYKAVISFEFPKGTLENTESSAVKKIIDDAVATESVVNDKKPGTIGLGQTPAEVEAILGKPDNIVNLGAKVTYVYKSMKVVFQDGKVADVL
jgi:hypothetical protein